jgi:hypothetical protein
MPEQSWLESRKKNSRWYGYTVFLIIFLVAAVIFLRNNRELLFSKRGPTAQEATHTLVSKPAAANLSAKPSGVAVTEAAKRSAALMKTDSVTISGILCRLRGDQTLRVVLSLTLLFPSGPLKGEVLLKRENLKVMVQKTIAEKSMDELIVDTLRGQTIRAMNRILEKGCITDVTFLNFTMEKAQ